MNREDYREVYLKSDHWRTVRLAALQRADNRCQVCNASSKLDVHHRTYERLGHESDADLTVLCRKCHDLFHSASGSPKSASAAPKTIERTPLGSLSYESIGYLSQAVPDPDRMWGRARAFLDTAPWSTAGEVAAACGYDLAPGTYADWAYRVLARACEDGLVERRTVKDGRRDSVQWARTSRRYIKGKTAASWRADRVSLVLTDEPQTTRQIAAAADMPVGKTGAALNTLRKQGRAVRQGKNGGWKLKRWTVLRSVA